MNLRQPLLAATLVLASAAASAAQITYVATMNGPSESPPVTSNGTGSATVVYDDVAHTLLVSATWSQLTGTTTVAHIHCCTNNPGLLTAGVAVTPSTLPGFPTGLQAGNYGPTLIDLTLTTSFVGTFLTASGGNAAGAETALIAGINAGKAYFNIHSSFAGSGEIRGFLAPVPAPAAVWLLGSGVALVLGRRLTRRHRS